MRRASNTGLCQLPSSLSLRAMQVDHHRSPRIDQRLAEDCNVQLAGIEVEWSVGDGGLRDAFMAEWNLTVTSGCLQLLRQLCGFTTLHGREAQSSTTSLSEETARRLLSVSAKRADRSWCTLATSSSAPEITMLPTTYPSRACYIPSFPDSFAIPNLVAHGFGKL